ncbi:6-phosphofructo-2-kinase/fructose-2,6-bisphosphatase [Halyomorpha halys]|uniref:6-phosphofructo-2-kinase/fructose-2, 6-bisphosphatase n=1 Tax=Halyomorpha halys TaxID=286706 RepID=UPI0006D4CA21|nr:6-phosphofructo-2-kinase/fructose-2,6-bisphosphatase [Halyomorpha halys]XP_014285659.1 6-phosphofructo-2-kinase/fructose-2,6-bisphosphatase [Halyomorpha halys]
MCPTNFTMGTKGNIENILSLNSSGHFVPLVVVLVGLPARGKTVLAHKLERYLNWNGHQTRVFSVSSYRKKHESQLFKSRDIMCPVDSKTAEIRNSYIHEAINDTQRWLNVGGDIAILDGTHPTFEIRQLLHDFFVKQLSYKILFIECILDDTNLIQENIKETAQLSEDYSHMEFKKAVNEINEKINMFSSVYKPICPRTEASYSYIKFNNAGENINVHRLDGPYQTKVLGFVSCFRPIRKTLYFSRHGESEFNLLGRIGGDTLLSARGKNYASLLANYFNSAKIDHLRVWTSEKKRTKQTAEGIEAPIENLIPLNELDAGICEGMSYEEMQDKFPQEFAWRDQDKLRYRYPWGESYLDIMSRLEPVLLELEREDSVLVISHQAVLRCIIGYFLNSNPDKLPYLNVPLHTVIKLTTKGYDFEVDYIKFNIDCVDTYRQQPENCSADRSMEDIQLTIPAHFDSTDIRLGDSFITA